MFTGLGRLVGAVAVVLVSTLPGAIGLAGGVAVCRGI
jgi:thiamine pyrophosphate-dependent acetolactate synthase large subunit-like protein